MYLLLLAGLLSCSGRSTEPPRTIPPPIFEVVSPSQGAVISVGWVPLLVRLTRPFADADVDTWLDGVPQTDPTGIVRARADGDWDYLATLRLDDLKPGLHRLDLRLTSPSGRTVWQAVEFTAALPAHPLALTLQDDAGDPISARVLVLRDGAPLPQAGPDAVAADPKLREPRLDSLFITQGRGVIHLDPGTYTLLAVRSIKDDLAVQTVTIPEDSAATLILPQVLETPGELLADLHVHTGRSGDAFIPHQLRIESLAAAGLDVAVITDHNVVTTLPVQAHLPGTPLQVVPGVESAIKKELPRDGGRKSLGHLNAFPLVGAEEAPLPDILPESIAAILADFRSRQAAAPYADQDTVTLQLNHPRGIQFFPEDEVKRGTHALFTTNRFTRSVPIGQGANAWMVPAEAGGLSPLDFDTMEIINRFSWPLYRTVRKDWFALWSQGWRLTGTGNSDSHATAVEPVGLPVNLIACPPQPLDLDCFQAALREGRVRVSTGPLVKLSLSADLQTAQIRVQAAPWVPVPEVRLIVNGETIARRSLDHGPEAAEPLDVSIDLPLALEADSWVLAEAGWPLRAALPEDPVAALGHYAHVAPGHVPIGFTNPIAVDVDGSGQWDPPGLATPE